MLADHDEIQILSRLKFGINGTNDDVHVFGYPGDEIPEWFSYQTCGTSINNITLPPFWNNDDFLGLVFCIVLARNKIVDDISVAASCKLNFKTIDDEHIYKCYNSSQSFEENKDISDHVVIWSSPFSKWNMESNKGTDGLNWPTTCSTEASFHMCLVYYEHSEHWSWREVNHLGSEYGEIKKFGVRLVYKQDIERCDANTEGKNKRRFNEWCESSGSEAIGSHEEEEDDESHSKKLKVM